MEDPGGSGTAEVGFLLPQTFPELFLIFSNAKRCCILCQLKKTRWEMSGAGFPLAGSILLCRAAGTASRLQAAARSDEGDLLLLNAPGLSFAQAHSKPRGHIQH